MRDASRPRPSQTAAHLTTLHRRLVLQDEDKGKRPVHEALQSDSEGEAEQDGVLLGGDRAECASGSGCSATHKCRREEQEEGGEVSVPPASPRGSEAGDLTCAICLNNIPLENMALVKV
jgi:hypothetical protein